MARWLRGRLGTLLLTLVSLGALAATPKRVLILDSLDTAPLSAAASAFRADGLPAGNVIEFREPSFWKRYRWHIAGVLAFCAVQTALIIGLTANALARKRAEQALRESEERMTLAAEAAEFGVWGWSLGRNRVWGSDTWLRRFGFAAGEEIASETAMERIHPDDRETLKREVERAVANQNLCVGEFRAVLPDGTLRWIAFRGRGSLDAKGKPDRMLGATIDITEIKQAHENLAQLERQNERMLNSAAEGILGLDLQGNHTFINPAAARMLGYKAEELLGRQSHGSWHHTRPDGSPDPEEECKICAAYADGKVHWESSEVFWRKDGTSFPVEYASRPMYENGVLRGAVVTFEDITVRKRAEDQVRQLTQAMEQSPALVVITDLQGTIIYVNHRFSEVTGYSAEECIGQNPRILKSGETPSSAYRELWTRITSGGVWRGEFYNRKKNGELYWEYAIISPLFDSTGKLTHFVGVKEDITEVKRSQAALRASEELNRVTFEQAAVGIAHLGTDGRWLRVNEKLCAMLGYQAGELTKLTFQEITHPEDLERELNFIRQLLSGEMEAYAIQKRYMHRNGSPVWVVLSVSLVQSAGGAPGYLIAVAKDITEQRRAETEAKELRGNLAHADRVTLLGQLASALAHELSQPLGAILRNAEAAEIMLENPSPDLEELRAIVTDIRRDDRRAGQVIDRLRSLLKWRSLDLQPVELQSVVAEVLSLIHTDAGARRVKIACALAPGLPLVRGDRIHLQQVLLNLIVNAMDAIDGGRPNDPRIQVLARQTDSATVEVRVSDNGPGIPGETLKRLFEPFFTTKAKGMGIGLAVSKTIIEAHQGRLWAEHGPEGGACFCFTLRAADLGGTP